MKSIVNIIGAIVQKSAFIKSAFQFIGGNSYRMIYYHMVSDQIPDYYFKDKGIRFEDFKSQIKYFKKHYTFITVNEAIKKEEKGESLNGYLSITTDDGFKENYTHIAPYLKEHNIPATLFLIDKCVDNKHLMWRNKLIYIQNKLGKTATFNLMYSFTQLNNLSTPLSNDDVMSWSKREFSMENKEELTDLFWNHCNMEPVSVFLEKHQPYMTTDQIKELIEQGFEIGAHGITHPYSEFVDYTLLEQEIVGSITNLEKRFGVDVKSFSYPFGSRANKNDENKIIKNHKEKIKALIGIRNNLKNNNPYKWERDLQEANLNTAAFRFFILPFFRKFSS